MDFGSHTHSHPLLSRLSLDKQREELEESRSILEYQLRSRVTAIAYPVGAEFAYTEETCQLARKAGYEVGFSFMRHINRFPLRRRMIMGRLGIDDDMDVDSLRKVTCFPSLFSG